LASLCTFYAQSRRIEAALSEAQPGTAQFGRLLRSATACTASAISLSRVLRLTVQSNVSRHARGQIAETDLPDDPLLHGPNVVALKRPRKKPREDPPPL
jgi:phage tail protein X